MIGQKELRIGNLVICNGSYYTVREILDEYVALMDTVMIRRYPLKVVYDAIEPVAIDEEWLVEYYFTRRDYSGQVFYNLGNFQLELRGRNRFYYNSIVKKKGVDHVVSKKIRYIHELQNICFALSLGDLDY